MNKKYVEYIDRNEYGEKKIVSGVFEVIEENKEFIKIKTKNNIITVPYHKIEKIKERC